MERQTFLSKNTHFAFFDVFLSVLCRLHQTGEFDCLINMASGLEYSRGALKVVKSKNKGRMVCDWKCVFLSLSLSHLLSFHFFSFSLPS